MNPIQLDNRQLLGFRIAAAPTQQNVGGKIGLGKVGQMQIRHTGTELLGGKIGGKVGVVKES